MTPKKEDSFSNSKFMQRAKLKLKKLARFKFSWVKELRNRKTEIKK